MKLITVLFAFMLLVGCSWGWLFLRVKVDIVNDTGSTVEAFYARISGTEDWGADRLGTDLEAGVTTSTLLRKGVYDFKAVSGTSILNLLENVDLQNVEIYVLNLGEETL